MRVASYSKLLGTFLCLREDGVELGGARHVGVDGSGLCLPHRKLLPHVLSALVELLELPALGLQHPLQLLLLGVCVQMHLHRRLLAVVLLGRCEHFFL